MQATVNLSLPVEDQKVLYTIQTETFALTTVTHICNTSDEIIATVEWHNVRHDTLTLVPVDEGGGGFEQLAEEECQPAVSSSRQRSSQFSAATFEGDVGRSYKWERTRPDKSLLVRYAFIRPRSPSLGSQNPIRA